MQFVNPCVNPSLFSALEKEWDGQTACFFFVGLDNTVYLYPADTLTKDYADSANGFIDSEEVSMHARKGVIKYRKVLDTYESVMKKRQADAEQMILSCKETCVWTGEEIQTTSDILTPKPDRLRELANRAFKAVAA